MTYTTKLDVSLADASTYLTAMLHRGDTLVFVSREVTKRQNLIVDVVSPSMDGSIGKYFGPLVDRPYIFRKRGFLMRREDRIEELVDQASTALFGEPKQLKAIWA